MVAMASRSSVWEVARKVLFTMYWTIGISSNNRVKFSSVGSWGKKVGGYEKISPDGLNEAETTQNNGVRTSRARKTRRMYVSTVRRGNFIFINSP